MFALGTRHCENKLDDIRATTFHLVGRPAWTALNFRPHALEK